MQINEEVFSEEHLLIKWVCILALRCKSNSESCFPQLQLAAACREACKDTLNSHVVGYEQKIDDGIKNLSICRFHWENISSHSRQQCVTATHQYLCHRSPPQENDVSSQTTNRHSHQITLFTIDVFPSCKCLHWDFHFSVTMQVICFIRHKGSLAELQTWDVPFT